MDNGEIDEVHNRLVRMQRSLAVLENDSDYEERKKQLEELKCKLEVILTPLLTIAFENEKLGTIFSNLKNNRNTRFYEVDLKNIYYNVYFR